MTSAHRIAERPVSAASPLLCLALLWLAGNGLRLTILAVPPVIPLIHADLGMSETEIGILSGLPPVLFALAAVPGSLLIAKFGPLRTLIIGLIATGLGSALRGAAPGVASLYAATVVTGFGVAVMQPSMPPLVRAWRPDGIGFATAVYSNGLLVGEVLPVALTVPAILPLVDGSWRADFMLWAVPCIVIALIVAALAPRSAASTETMAAPRRWWPDWRSGLIWRLGLMLGAVNALYFATNAFIPDYLHTTGQEAYVSAALAALNLGQIPASILLLLVAGKLERRPWPYVLCGVFGLVSVIGIVFGNAIIIVAAAALLGFAAAAVLVLMLALPPLLSPPDDVHRTSAAMFTISYTCAVVTPILSGLLWDMTAIPALAFLPIGLCAFLLIGLAPITAIPQH